jgi:metallo-beta-lactamase family protein
VSIKIRFFGAAQNVTGSSYVVEIDGSRLLVDCGLYQERELKSRNWDPFPVPPQDIDAVLLTHAHLDHCGRLPKLVRGGFSGPIHCTPATADIAKIVLLDSARIQEEDAAYKKKRHKREGRKGRYPEVPLYTVQDAESTLPLFAPVEYGESLPLTNGIDVAFADAGHILGSSSVRISSAGNGESKTLVFSGDVGRYDTPILNDPSAIGHADYVVVESTYGNRQHKDNAGIPDSLAQVINDTVDAGGNVIIPSFAVERAQELLYHLNGLLREKRIPQVPVFVDSPMAVSVTEVFRRHPELFDEDACALLDAGDHPCDFAGLRKTRSVAASKAINAHKGSAIILAGSGMCTGGRIKYHLVSNVGRPESTVLFVGYQAMGTLGRRLLEGEKEVRILGQNRLVKARVTKINGFSAHADQSELTEWLKTTDRSPSHTFVTHGEPESAHAFAELIETQLQWQTSVPSYGDEALLD